MRTALLAGVTAVLLLAGCQRQASTAAGSGNRNVITQEQIDASDAASVYDLVVKLRSDFFRNRGRISINAGNKIDRPLVFLNGAEYGIIETLRNIPINRMSEIRFYSGTEAAAKFGSQYGGGVIHLTSRNY